MSHHTMGSFFSGTDDSTLREGGNETNCWLMLIVDTQGKYVARITRKVTSKEKVITKSLGSSYEFFGEGSVPKGRKKDVEETVESSVIEYYDLEVERHEVKNPLASLDERFDEIERKKESNSKILNSSPFDISDDGSNWLQKKLNQQVNKFAQPVKTDSNFNSFLNNLKKANVEEPYLFDDETMNSITDPDAVAASWTPDKDLIHKAVCRMIACSLILNVENFNLRQWIKRHIGKVYDSIFNDDTCFDEWVEFAVQFFVFHFIDPSAPQEIESEEYFSSIAFAMMNEIEPFMDDEHLSYNDRQYLRKYYNELSTVIV